MTAQHTPGPWRVGDAGGTVYTAQEHLAPYRETVAYITRGFPTERHRANARLIAAAPDLLAALRAARFELAIYAEVCRAMADPEHCMHRDEHHGYDWQEIAARAVAAETATVVAIAQAEGEA